MTATIVRRHQFPLCGDRTGLLRKRVRHPGDQARRSEALRWAVTWHRACGPGAVHRPGATPRTGSPIVKDLVVGIDGSTTSLESSFDGGWHCRTVHGRSARLLRPARRPAAAEMVAFGLPVPETGEVDDGDELAQTFTEEIDRAGVVGDFTCRKGDVAHELEDLAEQSRSDVIVSGGGHATQHCT